MKDMQLHTDERDFIKQAGVEVKLQLRIREVFGSNTGEDTGYPNYVFSWLSSDP
jgi:hypothetical protein